MRITNCTIIQDGTLLEPDVRQKFGSFFNYRDISGKEKGDYINFVGFIISEDNTLVSFPKHFISEDQKDYITHEPIKLREYMNLLFQTILKYSKKNNEKHIGVKNDLNEGYPFQSFFEIYDYYKKYGLFTNEREIKHFGYQGNISWKDSLRKSPIVINNNNILYIPLVIKNKVHDYVFISKCMAYVINSTMDRFSVFLNLNKVPLDIYDIDFNNRDFIMSTLRKLKHSLFKDIHKRLIDNLITFFEHEKHGTNSIQIKIYTFNLIWEELVNDFLNKYFLKIDHSTNDIIFRKTETYNVFHKPTIYPDNIDKGKIKGEDNFLGYSLEPDSYFIKDSCRYIFDAKYYQNIKSLNYKQISYYFLLKWYESNINSEGIKTPVKTYNALILPTEAEYKRDTHFLLNTDFNEDEEEFMIIEYYLNVINLMRSYV